jgi:thiol-disulfide isomerase/thioredoxin
LGWRNITTRQRSKLEIPSPPIKVQAWVKGKPITGFENGKVYVLDFWATWCGGCIASFPHISAVAQKYKDKVSFLSVDSYEDVGENKETDAVSLVTEFLKTPRGQKLKLDVCIDGPNKTMYNTWINTLRRNGFPTTFIIDQEGKIAWIDVNLDHLDWALGQVLAKKWDRQKAAAVMLEKDAIEDMLFKIFRNKDTINKNNDYQALLAACETFEKKFPDRKDAVAFFKIMTLLELDINDVAGVLEQMGCGSSITIYYLSDAAGLTLRKKNLTRNTYAAVAKVQERLLLNEYPEKGYGGKSVTAYESLADTYFKAGDKSNAIASIKKGNRYGWRTKSYL